jgi:hypothetical protein
VCDAVTMETSSPLLETVIDHLVGPPPEPEHFGLRSAQDNVASAENRLAYQSAIADWTARSERTRQELVARLDCPLSQASPNDVFVAALGQAKADSDRIGRIRDRLMTFARTESSLSLSAIAKAAGLHYQTAVARVADTDTAESSLLLRRRETKMLEAQQDIPAAVAPALGHDSSATGPEGYWNMQVPLGLASQSEPMYWRPGREAHLLISGKLASGKTTLINAILWHLAQAGWDTWLLDPRLRQEASQQSLSIAPARADHRLRVLQWATDVLDDRHRSLGDESATVQDLQPICLVIDEWSSLVNEASRFLPPEQQDLPERLLDRLFRLGRSARIHLVVSTVSPETLPRRIIENAGARVSLQQMTERSNRVIWGSNQDAGLFTPDAPGRGLVLHEGRPRPFQAIYAPSPVAELQRQDEAMAFTFRLGVQQNLGPYRIDDTAETQRSIEDLLNLPILTNTGESPGIIKRSNSPEQDNDKSQAALRPRPAPDLQGIYALYPFPTNA